MSPRPNILIIHADQHNAQCLGAYGNSDIRTPHIDALAADGVRYDQHFCTYPVCTPSRYSLLSGLYVHQHLGWSNHCTLPQGLPTFPRILRDGGYSTAAVGKMHFTPTYLDVGFERMSLSEQDGPGRHDDDYHRWLREEGLCDKLDLMDQVREYRQHARQVYWDTAGALESDLDEAHHSTTWIAERAIEELAAWDGGGHLLMAGFIKPHHPFDPPAPWAGMYDPDALTLLPGWTDECLSTDLVRNPGYFPHENLDESTVRRAMAFYYASISQIDHHVGRMISLLKARGLYNDTLIIYTSDHGDYQGFHHLLLKGNHMYDPLMRIPLIVKYPGQADAGTRSDALTSNVDIAPTLVRLAGCEPAATMAGIDLVAQPDGRQIVFSEDRHGQWYMARTAHYKLLLGADEHQSLLFDLRDDPLELRNRIHAPEYADVLQSLRQALCHWLLFESVTPTHLNEYAPISSPNALGYDRARRAESMAYFRAQMESSYDDWD